MSVKVSLPLSSSRPPISVNGVVARETSYCGARAWGIMFNKVLARQRAALEGFVRRALSDLLVHPATSPSSEFDGLPSTNELKRVYRDAIEEIHRQEVEEARRKAKNRARPRRRRRAADS
jgi:hypothetical protein